MCADTASVEPRLTLLQTVVGDREPEKNRAWPLLRWPAVGLCGALILAAGSASAAPAAGPPPSVAGHSTGGTSDPVVPLSRSELVRRVERSAPGLDLLAADVAEAESELAAAGIWDNPSLSYDREEVFDAEGAVPENSLRLHIPIEISGRRALESKAAELGVDAARASSKHGRNALVLEALEIHARAAAARLEVGALEQEIASIGELVRVLGARRAEGDASGYDLERLEIEADNAADRVSTARLAVECYRRVLGWLLGTPAVRYDAIDDLALPPAPPDRDAPSATGAASMGSHSQAYAMRPDVEAARLRVTQAETEIEAAGRAWVPSLVLSGGLKTAVGQDGTLWGYGAGVEITLPFVDYGQGARARADARLTRAHAERTLLEAGARSGLRIAHESFARAREQSERFDQQQRPRSARLVRRASAAYVEGEQKIFELLDAIRTAREVELRSIALRLEARLRELETWRARGHVPEASP